MTRDDIWAAIELERHRQAAKWDREHEWGYGRLLKFCDVPEPVKVMALTEECGEVARAVLDGREPA